MSDKVYAVFLVSMIIGLSFLVLIVIGFCLREIFRRKHVPKPPEFIRVISPKETTRKVRTEEELKHIIATRGDLAYVSGNGYTYFYSGESWVKVTQKYYDDKRKETGDNI